MWIIPISLLVLPPSGHSHEPLRGVDHGRKYRAPKFLHWFEQNWTPGRRLEAVCGIAARV